jgi:RND family efflux transporter MFP subunit
MVISCSADKSSETTEIAPEPIAQVTTVKLQKTEMTETLTAYGVVLPFPDKLQTISLPYNSEIEAIQVTDGQLVQRGDVLLTVKSNADANLQLEQAREELDAAIQENKLLKDRIALKLATQQDLVTTQLRVDQAKVMIKNLKERGIGKSQSIKAEYTGMIHLVNVQQGQRVPAGNPLLQLIDQNQWVVRLGVEPEDFEHLQLKQQVLITPANKRFATPVKGRIETIAHQIDPTTRLLNVLVRTDTNQTLLINDFVQAEVILSSAQTLVAPRQAVLADGMAYSLFTIKKGHAVKHSVQVGLENDKHIEVIADDLQEQDEIVVLGNYELEDGMAVDVKQP